MFGKRYCFPINLKRKIREILLLGFIASCQSTNFSVSPSPLNLHWFCRLTFHALRCVLFPSGHLRPSKMFDYPCGLQFFSPWLQLVGPQKVKRSKTPNSILEISSPKTTVLDSLPLFFRYNTCGYPIGTCPDNHYLIVLANNPLVISDAIVAIISFGIHGTYAFMELMAKWNNNTFVKSLRVRLRTQSCTGSISFIHSYSYNFKIIETNDSRRRIGGWILILSYYCLHPLPILFHWIRIDNSRSRWYWTDLHRNHLQDYPYRAPTPGSPLFPAK